MKTFICWKCKQTFPKAWTDEEAEDEYKTLFGPPMGEPRETLCDNCDKEFKAWLEQQQQKAGN